MHMFHKKEKAYVMNTFERRALTRPFFAVELEIRDRGDAGDAALSLALACWQTCHSISVCAGVVTMSLCNACLSSPNGFAPTFTYGG